MFRFYSREDTLKISQAAQANDWDEVTRFYKSHPEQNRATLDEAICRGVMKNVESNHLRIDQENHILRALTLGPCTIKLPLIEKLRENSFIANHQDRLDFVKKLAEKSSDIYTVMFAKKIDFNAALLHVNKGHDIPREEALETIIAYMESFKTATTRPPF